MPIAALWHMRALLQALPESVGFDIEVGGEFGVVKVMAYSFQVRAASEAGPAPAAPYRLQVKMAVPNDVVRTAEVEVQRMVGPILQVRMRQAACCPGTCVPAAG